MIEITMPKLSDLMEEGTIIRWLKGEGEQVEVGTELLEVETDKATMTVESEAAGRLAIESSEGVTVPVGAVVARLMGDGDTPPAPSVGEPTMSISQAPTSSTSVGSANGASAAASAGPGRRVRASPVARRIAAELGIDLDMVTGTGPHARVTKTDVARAARAQTEAPAPSHPEAVTPAGPHPPTTGDEARGALRVERLSPTQLTVARRMVQAAAIPEFTVTVEVDMGAAVTLRRELTALGDDASVSFNDMVVKASALALRRHPRVNGCFREDRFELFDRVNVGVAVAAPDALLVPTIFDADSLSLSQIAGRTRELAERARRGAITPAEVQAGTFTVSNLGMYGIASFTAVLNPPQAAILAVGAVRECPVARDGELTVGHRMTLTLTCDHRILYGADGAVFLREIQLGLEQPLRLVV